jgi:hypothetical protein
MMPKPVFIYGLCEPETTIVRYIGKTKQSLRARLSAHMDPDNLLPNTHKNNWLMSLYIEGIRPDIIVLDIGDDETWPMLERFYIRSYKQAGFPLTNGDEGGRGNHSGKRPLKVIGWADKFDACVQCGTTEIKHAARGLCETCYCRVENRHLWQRQRTWDVELWSVAHPDLKGCIKCRSSNNPHAGNGLCIICYAAQYREKINSSPWVHRKFQCCQECGTTERSHCAKGLCRPCYMSLWYKNVGYAQQRERRHHKVT